MIDNLKALAAAIEGKSLSMAATKLFVTQSAISRRIQQLEETLGAPLFDRSQRPPVPTALGRRVYEQALPILSSVEALLEVAREGAEPRGTLRLGLPPALGDALPAAAVNRIKEEFPELEVRWRTDWVAGLVGKIVDGNLDAAFLLLQAGTGVMLPLVGRRIAVMDVVVVQSAARGGMKGSSTLSKLADRDWILNPVGCGYRSALESALGARGGSVRVAVDVYGSDAQLRMVASGLGLGLVPRAVLEASALQTDVRIVPVIDFAMKLEVWVASLGRLGNLNSAVELVAATLGDSLSGKHRAARTKPKRR